MVNHNQQQEGIKERDGCFRSGCPRRWAHEYPYFDKGRDDEYFQYGTGCSMMYKERTKKRAHMSVRNGASHTVKVQMTVDELQEWHRFKEINSRHIPTTEMAVVSADVCSNSSHLAKHKYNCTAAQWLIDSGASNHMANSYNEFSDYAPDFKRQSVKLADGSTQSVMGSGTVMCNSNITLPSVMHVPSFPIKLLSVSCITCELNCAGIFLPTRCLFQELGSGRILGTGTMRDGLYYLDKDVSPLVAAILSSSPLEEFLLQHRRLGHMSFPILGQLCPNLYNKVKKENLVCDACQFGKQTRSSYVSSDNRSDTPLQVIHSDVWGPSGASSLNGYRSFVTFIDYCTRVTWVYVLMNKSDVFECFVDFHNMIKTQYNASVKVLRTDNGTEYVNKEFDEYLSSFGIIHQTTCPGTSEQNGLAERKNRHLLEVTRCLMMEMNVPKFLWTEAVMTAAYLINRMPSRMLDYKTPIECLKGETSYVVPPKVFGCVCFVKDYRPSVGKLDSRALKCVFVGYSGKQKGYKCWCPSERRMFVSMDVVFRENEPYYGEPVDLTGVFPNLFFDDASDAHMETGEERQKNTMMLLQEV